METCCSASRAAAACKAYASLDGPIAAYNALVDAGKIKRDSHQLNALVPLQRLRIATIETGYAPSPRQGRQQKHRTVS